MHTVVQDNNANCYAKHYSKLPYKMLCMTLLPNVMHGDIHDIITGRRADCYAKYLKHDGMHNILHDTIT